MTFDASTARFFADRIWPIGPRDALTDVRLELVCRYVAGRDVDPVARGAAVVGCVAMARGDERIAETAVSIAECALGWWNDGD